MNLYKKYVNNAMNLVHNYSLEEVGLFKLLMIIVGLLLAKIFPVLLTGNILIYIVLIIGGSAVLLRNMKWK